MAFIATGIDVIYLHRLTETTTQLLFGLAAGVGIAGIVAHERRGTLAVPRLLIALGGASYSIYLVHFIVLSALAQFIVREGWIGAAPVEVEFVAVVAATLAIGYGFHRAVERPLLAALSAGRGIRRG